MEFAIPIDPTTFMAFYPTVTQVARNVGTPPKTRYTVTMSDPGGLSAPSWTTG